MTTTSTQPSGNNTLIIVIAIVVVAIVAVGAFMLMQDNRSGPERLGDAVQALPDGVDTAAGKLDDQSPAENVERNIDKAVN